MLMAAARLNIPCVVVSGGPMLAGRYQGKDVSVSTTFEAAGKFTAGKITEDEMYDLEAKACPGCGSCSGLFTANTMNTLTEVLGMGLPAMVQFQLLILVLEFHLPNKLVMYHGLIAKDIKPRDI